MKKAQVLILTQS